MKKFNEISGVFLIALLIILATHISTIVSNYKFELENIEDSYNIEQYTEEEIQNYAKALKLYYEGNYQADYEQLAINWMVTCAPQIGTPSIDFINEFWIDVMKTDIESNQNADYYAMAKENLQEYCDEQKQEAKEELTYEYERLLDINTILGVSVAVIELFVLIYCILYAEYNNWKEFLKTSLKIVLFVLIMEVISYVVYELIAIIENNVTFSEYWNSYLTPNISNINYWTNYIINPISLVLYYLIFVIGSLIRTYIVSKMELKRNVANNKH